MAKEDDIGKKYHVNGFQDENEDDQKEEDGVTIIIHETPG